MISWVLLIASAVCGIFSTGSFGQTDVCGHAPLNPKIVGGEDAKSGSWPWQVSLQKHGEHFCGGSLINRDWILSAAHCFFRTKPSIWRALLGGHSLQKETPNQVIRSVNRIIIHRDYDRKASFNDIALLRLSSPVKFTQFIRPVCLAASGSVFSDGTESWVTGWGAVAGGAWLPPPETLQEVNVPVIGNRRCGTLYDPINITSNMICAGLLEGGKDSCLGDSGGPMVSKMESVWIQSGIVSFGIGCAEPGFPGVYTRVSRYHAWIKSHLSSDEPGFVQFPSTVVKLDQKDN